MDSVPPIRPMHGEQHGRAPTLEWVLYRFVELGCAVFNLLARNLSRGGMSQQVLAE